MTAGAPRLPARGTIGTRLMTEKDMDSGRKRGVLSTDRASKRAEDVDDEADDDDEE